MFTFHKVSLLRNCIHILLLSKSNINLKFWAGTAIAWNYMKLRLCHNPEFLWYKVIKTCRRIQQQWSSWKSTREGRMNLKLLKNLFVYIFTLSVCKICTLQSEKKQKKDSQTVYSHSITPPVFVCKFLDWLPPPTCVCTSWIAPKTHQLLLKNI